jgi:hypothetical protein
LPTRFYGIQSEKILKQIYSKRISELDVGLMEWDSSVFLTFDIDWASDFVISDTLDLLNEYNVAATFFATHKTPILDVIRSNPRFELGIHPNFNDLLNTSEFDNVENARKRVHALKQIVPEALSVRSHSTTVSSKLLDLFKEFGIDYDCNYVIPYQVGQKIVPWRLWNDLIRVPYFYADDLSLAYRLADEDMPKICQTAGLKVFDFHPIHIYLNTDLSSTYESTRGIHRNENLLLKQRVPHRGTRNKFIELLQFVSDNERQTLK